MKSKRFQALTSTTELVVRVPARVEGSYDVHVFARDGREWTLAGALTYVADSAAGGGGGAEESGDGSGSDGSGTGPGGPDEDSDCAGDGADGSDEDSAGAVGPVVRAGPGGERLVRMSKFAALGSIWSLNCSVSCTGVAI